MPEHVNLVSAGSREDVGEAASREDVEEAAAAAAGCAAASRSLFSSATRAANRCFKRSFGLLGAIAMALVV